MCRCDFIQKDTKGSVVKIIQLGNIFNKIVEQKINKYKGQELYKGPQQGAPCIQTMSNAQRKAFWPGWIRTI